MARLRNREQFASPALSFNEEQRDELAALWEQHDFAGILDLYSKLAGIVPIGIYRAAIQEDPQDAIRDAEPHVRRALGGDDGPTAA